MTVFFISFLIGKLLRKKWILFGIHLSSFWRSLNFFLPWDLNDLLFYLNLRCQIIKRCFKVQNSWCFLSKSILVYNVLKSELVISKTMKFLYLPEILANYNQTQGVMIWKLGHFLASRSITECPRKRNLWFFNVRIYC